MLALPTFESRDFCLGHSMGCTPFWWNLFFIATSDRHPNRLSERSSVWPDRPTCHVIFIIPTRPTKALGLVWTDYGPTRSGIDSLRCILTAFSRIRQPLGLKNPLMIEALLSLALSPNFQTKVRQKLFELPAHSPILCTLLEKIDIFLKFGNWFVKLRKTIERIYVFNKDFFASQ